MEWPVPPVNANRLKLAADAIQLVDDSDPESALCDLLTDLQHWADTMGVDFDGSLITATKHFLYEQQLTPNLPLQ
jgi:hypothetical protein